MKIGILTIHFGVNHGSALQAYALNNYLKLKGYNVETINYVPARYKIWNILYKSKKNKYSLPVIATYYPIYFLKTIRSRLRFERFLNKYIVLSKKCNDINNLKKFSNDYNKIIVGSDQVWNDDYNGMGENTYFLDFVPSEIDKYSYAASFGKENIYDVNRLKEIKQLLERFNFITVREDSALEILKKMEITNSKHVVDPTFLISKEQWLEFSSNSKIKLSENEEYILVYVMDGIYDNLLNNAEIFSKKMNLPIYVICFNKIKDKRISRCFKNANPIDFVKLMSKASVVITNSFHGTAFSIIMDKPVLVIGKEKYNSRMQSLLKKTNLNNNFIKYNEIIEIGRVEQISSKKLSKNDKNDINTWISESKEILKYCCEENKNDR